MSKDEMRAVVTNELAKLRGWTYPALAEAVERSRREHDHLHRVEGVASDGTPYLIDFDVFWDDQPNGNVRVCGSLWAEPPRKLLGFLPVYSPHWSDSFIMNPSSGFVGEDDKQGA